jgi:hypothetical protein
MRYLLMMLIMMLVAAPVYAAHPLITDDAGTQGKGKFQLEVNGQYGYDRDGEVVLKSSNVAATLTYGAVDTVDIIVGMPYQWLRTKDSVSISNENGIGDTALAVKWRFYETDGFSFAMKPGVNLPTGDSDRGMGNGKVGGSIFFITTKEMKPWAFHLNAGYIFNQNKVDQQLNLWHASAAAEYEVIKNLRLVANIGAQRNALKDSDTPPIFLIGGIIYSLTEKIDLDAGYKFGLTRTELDHTVMAGITLRF